MNWLSLLSEPERRAIVAELARLLAQEPPLTSAFEAAVERVIIRHQIGITIARFVDLISTARNCMVTVAQNIENFAPIGPGSNSLLCNIKELRDCAESLRSSPIKPDPVLTTAHGPILDLINQCRDIAAFFRHDNPNARPTYQEGGRAFDRLLSAAAAAEAALPKVKL